jgi:hypothetical protein
MKNNCTDRELNWQPQHSQTINVPLTTRLLYHDMRAKWHHHMGCEMTTSDMSEPSLYYFIIVYSILLPVPLQKQHVIAVTLWSVKCRDIDKWSTLHYESGIWDSIAKYRPLESCRQAHAQMGLRFPKTRNGINPNLVHAITSRRSGHIWKVGTF